LLLLIESAGDPNPSVLYEKLERLIQIFFTETISRYGQGWKPDLPTSAIVEIAAEAEASMEEFKSASLPLLLLLTLPLC
jgi:hypothetical protein